MKTIQQLYDDICNDVNTPVRERMLERFKLYDLQSILNPREVYELFKSDGATPFYADYGQFCGGIESVWYKKDGRVYKFVFEDDSIVEATSENDIEK